LGDDDNRNSGAAVDNSELTDGQLSLSSQLSLLLPFQPKTQTVHDTQIIDNADEFDWSPEWLPHHLYPREECPAELTALQEETNSVRLEEPRQEPIAFDTQRFWLEIGHSVSIPS
jgi:hypothetical protein